MTVGPPPPAIQGAELPLMTIMTIESGQRCDHACRHPWEANQTELNSKVQRDRTRVG